MPSNLKADIVYTVNKFSCKFNVKDKPPIEEQHDLLYRAVCTTDNCTADYVGETARCIMERANDHNGGDQDSHLLKYDTEKNHLPVVNGDFTIVDSGYRNNTREKKIAAESLIIKRQRNGIKFFN